MWFSDHLEVEPPQERNDEPFQIRPILAVDVPLDDMLANLATAWSNGLRFKDINEDHGVYDKDSMEGLSLNSQSVSHVRLANGLRESGRNGEAEDLYTEALQVSGKVKNNGEILGEIFAYRSMVYQNLEDHDKAYDDAVSAIRCHPTLREANRQMTSVLESMGKRGDAFYLFLAQFALFKPSDVYLVGAVKLATKVQGGLAILANKTYHAEAWVPVIETLCEEGSWSSVRILLMGTDDLPALVTSFDASKIQLSGLLESCRETSLKEWGQKLALLLIRKGANHQTLCAKSKYPLHVALQLTLKIDTFELLKWLLANKAGTNISCTDENGNNLLHLACRSKTSAKRTAVKLLLNHKVDASAKNNDGKIPLDYLDKQDKDYDAVKKQMGIKTDVAPSKDSLPAGSLVPVTKTSSGLSSVVSTPGLPYPTQIILDFEHLKTWTKTRVQKWLESCNLDQHKKKFKDVDGPLLYEMKMMQDVAPEMFYKVLEESLQLPLVDLLKVSYSLRHIPQTS